MPLTLSFFLFRVFFFYISVAWFHLRQCSPAFPYWPGSKDSALYLNLQYSKFPSPEKSIFLWSHTHSIQRAASRNRKQLSSHVTAHEKQRKHFFPVQYLSDGESRNFIDLWAPEYFLHKCIRIWGAPKEFLETVQSRYQSTKSHLLPQGSPAPPGYLQVAGYSSGSGLRVRDQEDHSWKPSNTCPPQTLASTCICSSTVRARRYTGLREPTHSSRRRIRRRCVQTNPGPRYACHLSPMKPAHVDHSTVPSRLVYLGKSPILSFKKAFASSLPLLVCTW